MRSVLFMAAVIAAVSFADGVETQTDWSGGPGIPGPVTTFGTAFDYSCGIDESVSGELTPSGEHILDLTADAPRWSEVGDLDGDGDMDVLVGAYTSDSLFWYENLDGWASLWERHPIGYGDGPSRVAIHDMDGDMDLDALCGYFTSDFAAWYENDGSGGGWTQHDIDLDMDGCRGLVVEDIDSDGDPDVFSASYNDDYACWMENTDGLGTAWTKINIGTSNGPRLEDAIDIDYDGDLDVCVGAYTADSLLWYENTGYGNPWVRHTISGTFNGARGGFFNDFNGDMYIDVVSVCATGDSLCWFENADFTGTSWTRHYIDTHDNAWMCNTADIDDDGDSDIMVCGTTEHATYWYENDGSGNWTKYPVCDKYSGPMFVGAFDVDDDGDMELVVTDSNSDVVAFYDVMLYEGVLVSSIFDAQEDAVWGTMDWTATIPSAADVSFTVRSSDDPADMGDWSSPFSTPGASLAPYTTVGDNYIQYAVVLGGEDMAGLPVLEDVTINWIYDGIEGSFAGVDGYGLSIVSGNPTALPVLGVNIPRSGTVALSVFDLSGRIVDSVNSDNLEAGSYQVTLEGLFPGTYFVRMSSGDFTATEKLVLIR